MSNNQMVLAPRELLERLDLGKNTAAAMAALPELRELLAKPAEQPQGEPVEVLGYSVKGNRYAIRLTKTELLELYEGYTGDALIELVDRRLLDGRADPAEVERLRAGLRDEIEAGDSWKREAQELRAQLADLTTERDRLREGLDNANINIANWLKRSQRQDAQLAERDALLREALKLHIGLDLAGRIDAALSASAEPSAPIERDERAAFERAIVAEWPQAPLSRKRDLLPKDDPCYGDYCDEPLQRAWGGWQARAALERKP